MSMARVSIPQGPQSEVPNMFPTCSSAQRQPPDSLSTDRLSRPLSGILITLTVPLTPCWVIVTLNFIARVPTSSGLEGLGGLGPQSREHGVHSGPRAQAVEVDMGCSGLRNTGGLCQSSGETGLTFSTER